MNTIIEVCLIPFADCIICPGRYIPRTKDATVSIDWCCICDKLHIKVNIATSALNSCMLQIS